VVCQGEGELCKEGKDEIASEYLPNGFCGHILILPVVQTYSILFCDEFVKLSALKGGDYGVLSGQLQRQNGEPLFDETVLT
jgi:hypothetical protein